MDFKIFRLDFSRKKKISNTNFSKKNYTAPKDKFSNDFKHENENYMKVWQS